MVSVNVVLPIEGEERAARAPSSACLCSLARAVTLTVQGELCMLALPGGGQGNSPSIQTPDAWQTGALG